MTYCIGLVTLILAVGGLSCSLPVFSHVLVNELSQNQIGRCFILEPDHITQISSFPAFHVGHTHRTLAPGLQKTFTALAALVERGGKTQKGWGIFANPHYTVKALAQQRNFLG